MTSSLINNIINNIYKRVILEANEVRLVSRVGQRGSQLVG